MATLNRTFSPAYNVASVVFTKIPTQLTIVQGYFRGATADRWLQIHDATALPADGAIPLKSYALPQKSPFSWGWLDSHLPLANGLVVAVSTTEGTLTISTDTMDCFGDIQEYEEQTPFTETSSGDLTTGRNILGVWNVNAGPKRLTSLQWINGEAVSAYMMLFADTNNPADGSAPVIEFPVVAAAGTATYKFGTSGRTMQSQSTAGVNSYGCIAVVSTTPGVLTRGMSGASNIKAMSTNF